MGREAPASHDASRASAILTADRHATIKKVRSAAAAAAAVAATARATAGVEAYPAAYSKFGLI